MAALDWALRSMGPSNRRRASAPVSGVPRRRLRCQRRRCGGGRRLGRRVVDLERGRAGGQVRQRRAFEQAALGTRTLSGDYRAVRGDRGTHATYAGQSLMTIACVVSGRTPTPQVYLGNYLSFASLTMSSHPIFGVGQMGS